MTIFDCFTYAGEEDQLAMRMEELADLDVVHVAVEGTNTFQGKPRTLTLEPNRRADHFRYVVVDDWPLTSDPWVREAHQRNAIVRGLDGAQTDDIVIVSDADEIPRADAVRWAAERLQPRFAHRDRIALEARTYWYYLDLQVGPPNAFHPTVARAQEVLMISPQAVRYSPTCRYVANNSWHFSWLGGVDEVVAKANAFAHTEYSGLDPADVGAHIEGLETITGQPLIPVEVDSKYPACVRANRNRWAHLMRPR